MVIAQQLCEKLWLESEAPTSTEYEKIFVAHSNGHDYRVVIRRLRQIVRLAEKMDRFAMYDKIRDLIPTYQPSTNGKAMEVEL